MRKAALLLSFVLVLCASAQAAGTAPPAAPSNLTAFLLRSTEPETHSFPRTPSFAWTPVRRAARYELELATNQGFAEGNVLWSEDKLRQPVAAIPLQLPWMVGKPYALWVHVRAIGKDGKVSPWSTPFGFNMRWRDSDVPQKLPSPPGLVRWAPVEGATAYDVLYPDIAAAKAFQTTTNVADEREFYTFHDSYAWTAPIHWRVRAVRFVDAAIAARNGLPRVSYGPWSPLFTSVNPPASFGSLTPNVTVSDEYVKAGETARPHELTPGFAWSGTASIPGYPAGSPLYRVYISTDDHCVNRVFSGAVVGSPAYAPRTKGGPMTLPQNTSDLATAKGGLVSVGGSEGAAFDATGDKVLTNEDPGNAVDKDSAGGSGSGSGGSGGATGGADAGVARVDLWDSGWPNGRYYWTVVPVEVLPIGKAAKPEDSQPLEYHDMNVPQDACESGRLGSFGKVSKPVVAESSTPFASGLSPTGRMIAAATTSPTFHSSPLVAWEPATGATTYEVQWSKGASYPWKTAGSLQTHATSAVLPLTTPATWWYRVRGINPALPAGAQKMTWSAPVALRLTGDQYRVLR